tara:strand:- start:272 stop:451 length:180 start_codon:yes stop_codon:yes gene_type:complete
VVEVEQQVMVQLELLVLQVDQVVVVGDIILHKEQVELVILLLQVHLKVILVEQLVLLLE